MQIEIKDRLIDLKEHNIKLLEYVKSTLNNDYFLSISEKLKDIQFNKNDIAVEFGAYLYKILYPITYKTISDQTSQDKVNIKQQKKLSYSYNTRYQYRSKPNHIDAVGKWFGQLVNTNISYISEKYTYDNLTEKHIQLIPVKKKQKVAQDFYDFKQTLKSLTEDGRRSFPINVDTVFHKISNVHVDSTDTSDNKKYIDVIGKYIKKIDNVGIGQSLNPFTLLIGVNITNESSFQEEFQIQADVISSNALTGFHSNLHSYKEISFNDPQIFLNDDIKTYITNLIDAAKNIHNKWEALKMKYAYLLLQKGKI